MAASTRAAKHRPGKTPLSPRTDTELLNSLCAALDRERDAKYADWLERYLRHETPSRGVRIPKIRAVVREWHSTSGSGISSLCAERQRRLAHALVRLPTVEDKLAGAVLMQDLLVPGGLMAHEHVRALEYLFDEGHIHDWHCCDWFCVRVLSQIVQRQPDETVPVVLAWHTAHNVWRARSSVVALLPLAAHPGWYDDLAAAAAVLVRREERFAKTAVGWLFAEIAKHDRMFVDGFLNENLKFFSVEALNKVIKGFSKSEQICYRNKLKMVDE